MTRTTTAPPKTNITTYDKADREAEIEAWRTSLSETRASATAYQAGLDAAKRYHEQIRDSLKAGDPTPSALDLVESAAGIERAELLARAAQQKAERSSKHGPTTAELGEHVTGTLDAAFAFPVLHVVDLGQIVSVPDSLPTVYVREANHKLDGGSGRMFGTVELAVVRSELHEPFSASVIESKLAKAGVESGVTLGGSRGLTGGVVDRYRVSVSRFYPRFPYIERIRPGDLSSLGERLAKELEAAFIVHRGQATTGRADGTSKFVSEEVDEEGRRTVLVQVDLAVQSRGLAMSDRPIWTRNEVGERAKRFIEGLEGRVFTGGRVALVEIADSGPLADSETGIGYRIGLALASATQA